MSYSLLFSPSRLASAVMLYGSSLLVQRGYGSAAGLLLLGGNASQPLLLMCLLPLLMKRCTIKYGKSKDPSIAPMLWEVIVVVTSSLIALARFVTFTQHELLPLVVSSSKSYYRYLNYEILISGSFLSNLIVFSDLWVSGVRGTIQKTIGILISTDYAKPWYQPSMGIRWYLDAQMIPEYSLYFELLFILQPIVCAGLLYSFIVDKNKTVGVHIMMVIVMLFSRDLVLLDFAFGIALLMQHTEIIRGMHNLPVIVAGITVPAILSPLMLSLWVDRGTGNANYFFFQGLCLWLFSALGIVEFTSSFMRTFAAKATVVST